MLFNMLNRVLLRSTNAAAKGNVGQFNHGAVSHSVAPIAVQPLMIRSTNAKPRWTMCQHIRIKVSKLLLNFLSIFEDTYGIPVRFPNYC